MADENDPLAGSTWSDPETVAGFAQSPPNTVLITFADRLLRSGHGPNALDLGCGAGRNAVPLVRLGWHVTGIDLSWPMLRAASRRASDDRLGNSLHLVLAPMDRLPIRDCCCDLVVAHGAWNLARSAAEFRRSVQEAARVARSGALLFVFTFSRSTLPAEARPLAGEPFVFTQFSGQPQCFLTGEQLIAELGDARFVPDPSVPLTEHNRPRPGALATGSPVIYEAAFRLEA